MSDMFKELSDAKMAYVSAVGRKSGVNPAKERMMKLLFNYYDDLVALAEENKRLKEENESLNVALQEADEDLNKAEAELKRMASNAKAKKIVTPVEE